MGKSLNDEAKLWDKGEFQIGDAPNPHALLYEHAKSIATLSIAFLGFSVGYAEKLVTVGKFPYANLTLSAAWILLVLSIILVLAGSVEFHKYLLKPPVPSTDPVVDGKNRERYKKQHNRAVAEIGFAGLFFFI